MQAKNEISNELRLLSAVMDSISRETPYGVPAGYFDSLPALVLSRVMSTTSQLGAEAPFMDEMNEPAFLFEKSKPLTFSVPEGYFDGFAQGLLDRIKAESVSAELARLSPLLSGISRQTPYQMPANYFEELSSFLPVLEEVRELPLYTVPEGYFDGLAGEVLLKIAPAKQQAKVISLNRSFRQRSWWKYSAAAVVAGFILTIGWLRLHTTSSTPVRPAPVDNIASNLVKVSDQDLQGYLDNQDDQNATIAEPMNSTATLDITDSDVKSLLGDVPDGDLKSYMEEHGGPNDIATN